MKRLIANHHYVRALTDMLQNTSVDREAAARFVRMIILDHMWKRRFVKELGRKVFFDAFGDFVCAPPPQGLGTTVPELRYLCLPDRYAVQLIDRALANKKARRISAKTHLEVGFNLGDSSSRGEGNITPRKGAQRL